MKNRLLHLLGVEAGEESVVSLLLSQSVFLGLFYGAFDISAHSLFLAQFDETMMARAYVVSGLAGIVLTSLYSFIQTRMQFKNFAVLNLLFVTAATAILWVFLLAGGSRALVFATFVMMGPLNILAMLGFWGTSGRLFTLRQGKRLFGLIDAGIIIGIVISSYAIPVLLTFGFNTHNIILLSSVAVLLATIVQYSLGTTHSLGDTSQVRKGSVSRALKMFRDDSYILNMGIFVAVSVMTAFFVQYSFMAVTRAQYPLEADMAKFLGLFIGSMMIFTLILKTFLFSYLIKNYGLKVMLIMPPFLLMIFTAAAAGLGSSLGYVPAAGGFMIFFLILALSRLISKAVRDAVETPSFKVIYQTISEKVRYDVQSIVDGTVNEIAALTSGLLLSGLGIIVAGRLISFSWVLLAITIIWLFVGFRLYNEYRKAIIRSLDEAGTQEAGNKAGPAAGMQGKLQAGMVIRDAYPSLVDEEFSILHGENSEMMAGLLTGLAEESSDINLVPALKHIAGLQTIPEGIREEAAELAAVISRSGRIKSDPFLKLPVGPEVSELLADRRTPQPSSLLSTLRDGSPASKRAAIVLIGKHRITDMVPEVCELAARPDTAIDAMAVLERIGSASYSEIVRVFLRSSGNPIMMKNLLTIMGRACYAEASGFIYQMLRTNSRTVRRLAAEILIDKKYRVPENELDRMHQLISEIAGVLTWHIQAMVALGKSGNSILHSAAGREMKWWYDFLFMLLKISYDSHQITRIRENLDAGTVESVNFALEMIDIVIDESVKAKVAACVDLIPDEDKLKTLHHFYPGFVPDYNDLVIELINRDYNLTSVWTKAIAVRSLSEQNLPAGAELTLSSLLFSPNMLLVEEAARVLAEKSPSTLAGIRYRLPGSSVEVVESVAGGKRGTEGFLFEKTCLLKSCLPEIPEDDLVYLAGMVTPAGNEHKGAGNYVIGGGSNSGSGGDGPYTLSEEAVRGFLSMYPEYIHKAGLLPCSQ